MELAMLIIAIVGIVIAIIALPDEKCKYVVGLPKHLVTKVRYWLKSLKCFYPTKIYLGKSVQADELAYVYVVRKGFLLRDISWRPAEWIKIIRIKLGRWKNNTPKFVLPCELGVLKILAIYRTQRGGKPDWVDERFLVMDEILPMFTWQVFHEWRRGVLRTYNGKEVLLGYRFKMPQWREYSDNSVDPKAPDWDEENVRLFRYSPRVSHKIKSELEDLKKKYELHYFSWSSRGEQRIGEPKWTWIEKEESEPSL